ncbi:CDP-diacylglycerol--glycerol-3-phosphate 3-phosphatidyltransferase [Aquicoccus sp. SU-CL01552]|uniref:CDP-diacylglycerol--glycerol-3-phosphate 3-phosphatidyltransferase n=1 Tax=Aquicoccus sp. SU-CL01552 TaxID=3127656 RepID=UPI003104C331
MRWNLPNILTLLRLLAAPGLAVMFLYFSRPYADWYALVLFVGAAATDWFDGYLARAWKQETKMGAMLDPIADKAMVVIALMILVGYAAEHWTPWLVLPATVILFREVFVSGLREYLGDTAGTLKVTKLAKWKTTAQMIAIATLFSQGIFEHHLVMKSWGMDEALLQQVLNGETEDLYGLRLMYDGMVWSGRLGLWLLWIAAALTLITGADYLRKALPHLRETR